MKPVLPAGMACRQIVQKKATGEPGVGDPT
jgi:hypothetical protein